jgi:hypothetical protein
MDKIQVVLEYVQAKRKECDMKAEYNDLKGDTVEKSGLSRESYDRRRIEEFAKVAVLYEIENFLANMRMD